MNSIKWWKENITLILIEALVVWFVWYIIWINQNISFVNNWVNNWTQAWIIEEYNDVQPTPLEVENQKFKQENEDKIRWFFRYLNAWEIADAQNNIFHELSYLFTSEKLQYINDNLTSLIVINNINDLEGWKIGNSAELIYSKHDVTITYGLKNQQHKESIFIVVRREKENLIEHHIEQFWCNDKDPWPLCLIIADEKFEK